MSDSLKAKQGLLANLPHISEWAPLLMLIVPIILFSLTVEGFFRLGTLSQILSQGSVLAITATGLTFVLLCGEIDLSVGEMALLVACLCGLLYESKFIGGKEADGISWGMTILICVGPILCGMILGFIAGYFTVTAKLPSFIITLTMMYIANGAALFLTKSALMEVPDQLTVIGNDAFFSWKVKWGGHVDILHLPFSAIVAGFVMIVSHLVLEHTRFGRHVMMTGGNREAARLAGVRTSRILIYCLVISAATAGLAGIVNAGRLNSVSLDQNRDLLLNAVACVVLGGTSLFGGEGSIRRTLLGVLTYVTLMVGLNQMKAPFAGFDFLRAFLLGVILLGALVLNGHLQQLRKK